MTSLSKCFPSVLLLALAHNAFAQSDFAKPTFDTSKEKDHLICQRTVEGVDFFYGFFDGHWQAIEALGENHVEVVDCDEYYQVPGTPVG